MWVLWGQKYVDEPIKIMGGTKRECRLALRSRQREGGWTGLIILPKS